MKLNLKKILPYTAAFLAVVLFASGAFIAGYWYKERMTPKTEAQQETICKDCIKPLPAPDTSNWKTYRNEELGFEVKYPDELSVIKPLDYAQQIGEYFSEYSRKCESGEIRGCGGGPLPKYMFKFLTFYQENLKSLDKSPFTEPEEFSIRIYETNAVLGQSQGPIGKTGIRWKKDKYYLSGLIDKSQVSYTTEASDGFTYMINFSYEYLPEKYTNLTDAIVSTFKFLK